MLQNCEKQNNKKDIRTSITVRQCWKFEETTTIFEVTLNKTYFAMLLLIILPYIYTILQTAVLLNFWVGWWRLCRKTQKYLKLIVCLFICWFLFVFFMWFCFNNYKIVFIYSNVHLVVEKGKCMANTYSEHRYVWK